MRVLVTGSAGQLGYQTLRTLSEDVELVPTSKRGGFIGEFSAIGMNIANFGQVDLIIEEKKPDIIVNCAAFTNVDACEMSPKIAKEVNSDSVSHLAKSCSQRGIKLIQISSDYVFDGENPPYVEESERNPIQEYGKSKSSAEDIIQSEMGLDWAIVRASGIFSFTHNNFLTWLLKSAKANEEIFVVGDQISTPVSAFSLSKFISKIIADNLLGVWNFGSNDAVSRLEFSRMVCDSFDVKAQNISETKMGSISWKAKRPINTSFDTKKIREAFFDVNVSQMIEELALEYSKQSFDNDVNENII